MVISPKHPSHTVPTPRGAQVWRPGAARTFVWEVIPSFGGLFAWNHLSALLAVLAGGRGVLASLAHDALLGTLILFGTSLRRVSPLELVLWGKGSGVKGGEGGCALCLPCPRLIHCTGPPFGYGGMTSCSPSSFPQQQPFSGGRVPRAGFWAPKPFMRVSGRGRTREVAGVGIRRCLFGIS